MERGAPLGGLLGLAGFRRRVEIHDAETHRSQWRADTLTAEGTKGDIQRAGYCPKSLCRVSGQNSFITLNKVSRPICCPHLSAVLLKDRS
jgi:hypothetical protein